MDRLTRPNILLARDDVGKPKPCTIKLPPQSFVYGKPEYKKEAGSGNVIFGDFTESLQPKKSQVIKPTVDFKKLNKA